MAARVLTIVMTYDVTRTRTRRRVAGLLEERMTRVQQSVFEARLTSPAAGNLFDIVSGILDEGDSLRMYVMTRSGLEKSRTFGGAPLPEERDFWLL
jgi:CRISPR-associated protein Cas2